MSLVQKSPGGGELRRRNKGLTLCFVICFMISSFTVGFTPTSLQTDEPDDAVLEMLAQLTPEERVGQLFLLTFLGTQIDEESQIYDLIVNHHIGGVILLAENDNFIEIDNSPLQVQSLIRQLQRHEFLGAQLDEGSESIDEPEHPTFVPLLIGISQEGDGAPFDQILNGLTPLPNEMAIGATWQPALAEQIGYVLGQELAAMGFNLLLGPSLDVLEIPKPESPGDLGVRTFGGDPFWVSEMGQAYITGVHLGSENRVAVVAKHFPGHGGSDRPPEEEVPTVRKSLEQLKQIELAPFFEVTSNAPTIESTTDALLTAHIRYEGFQGNIRQTTRPVSFDDQALTQLMSLPQFSPWRENGGVLISDRLGSQAVRRFFDPSGETFKARRVALDAFLAGNDLLYLGDFVASEDEDSYTTTIHTLEFFAQKYREDVAFAQRVDESVIRILTLKYRLYSSYSIGPILRFEQDLEGIGTSDNVTFDVARQGATLISPSPEELVALIPEPPGLNDRMTFIVDTFTSQQCSECPEQTAFEIDALRQTVLRLYGPLAASQITSRNLKTYSFADLNDLLDGDIAQQILMNDINNSDWLVFAMLDIDPNRPESMALRRFLSERPDLQREKNIIVFAFNAPYYLDATDISKLTAYYGLYSKGPQFVEIAARLLFNELNAPGYLPISVTGVGYDLFTATSPDPEQIIPVLLDLPEPEISEDETPVPAPEPIFRIGDLIPVRTGVIVDHNGNPVPDGTPVQFTLSITGEAGIILDERIHTTIEGTARTTYTIDTAGSLEISVESKEAYMSSPVQLEIPADSEISADLTVSPQPTLETSPSPSPEGGESSGDEQDETNLPKTNPDFGDWLLAVFVSALVGLGAYWVGSSMGIIRWGIRWGFTAIIGGFSVFLYLAIGLPGTVKIFEVLASWGVVLLTLGGAALGWFAGWVWQVVKETISTNGSTSQSD